jgi:hypothetical protein
MGRSRTTWRWPESTIRPRAALPRVRRASWSSSPHRVVNSRASPRAHGPTARSSGAESSGSGRPGTGGCPARRSSIRLAQKGPYDVANVPILQASDPIAPAARPASPLRPPGILLCPSVSVLARQATPARWRPNPNCIVIHPSLAQRALAGSGSGCHNQGMFPHRFPHQPDFSEGRVSGVAVEPGDNRPISAFRRISATPPGAFPLRASSQPAC